MKQAALGLRMHSGWGVLVAIFGVPPEFQIAYRARIKVCDAIGPRGNQPYHHAAQLGLPAAEIFLEEYSADAERLASAEISAAIDQLRSRDLRVTAVGILLASGRALPQLPEVLASHPLIHTAEGELFRNAARKACEGLGLRCEGVRERDLDECAASIWGRAAPAIQKQIADLGKTLGPPWTQDQKTAALAAAMALTKGSAKFGSANTAS
jgi:hypothetical protein